MNWEAAGAIGEIIGALAVFVTLVYLARQIKQNTNAQTVATYDAAMSGFIETNSPIANSLETATLWRKAIENPDSLTLDEEVQFEFLVRNYTNHLLKVFRLYEKGVFPATDWQLFATEAKQFFTTPIARQFQENNKLFQDLWAELEAKSLEEISFLNRPGFQSNA